MGAWSEASFDNDDAGDWVWDLERAADTSILQEAFLAVAEAGEYPEAPDCSVAVAAAEVVAALRHHPAARLPEEVQVFVSRLGRPPSAALVASALAALKQITTKSELRDLWDESDHREQWYAVMADLESRLR
jgi:hypothetical protein